MKIFIFLLMQVMVFLPLAGYAAGTDSPPLGQKTETPAQGLAVKTRAMKAYGKIPLYFIENMGQVDKDVVFYERGDGHAAFFTKDGVVLALARRGDTGKKDPSAADEAQNRDGDAGPASDALTLSFLGASPETKIMAEKRMTGHVNYFVGNDKRAWRSNIPTYGAVLYRDVYKNIDIRFYGNNRDFEHDIIVRPGGDPEAVQFAYSGIKGLRVTEDGDLEVEMAHGSIIEKRPFIYQEIDGRKVRVDGAFKVLGGKEGTFRYGFSLASYDRSRELVIDPVVQYSTYIGGTSFDNGEALIVDGTGAVYVTGKTQSLDFPLSNPLQGANPGSFTAFVTKIDPAGTSLVYSTFLGGSGADYGYDIAVDGTGAVYVAGITGSMDFPLVNPIQAVNNGLGDVFLTKIDPAGASIVYSTFLGGSAGEMTVAIGLDSSGAVYLAGETFSADFPVVNALQGAHGGATDAFLTKIDAAGTAIVYSTFLGGTDYDRAHGIAVDGSGAVYLAGDTVSADFPAMNPIQAVNAGSSDAFAAKIDPTGQAMVYSTYLGGTMVDYCNGIAIDSAGAAYIVGTTNSADFPLVNPIQGILGGGGTDAFVAKIDPAGSAIVYSTYLGGWDYESGWAIAVDGTGAAYVTGSTNSIDFPVINPIQATRSVNDDVFITKFDPTGQSLLFSTYYGNSGFDYGRDIALDSAGSAYVTGFTSSLNFPLVNPIQRYSGGREDVFLTKIAFSAIPDVTILLFPNNTLLVGGTSLSYTVQATNNTNVRQCVKYWENVTLPNGSLYPVTGELFGPVSFCLDPLSTSTASFSRAVPKSAPLGTYTYNAFVGTSPPAAAGEAHFNFSVDAAVVK